MVGTIAVFLLGRSSGDFNPLPLLLAIVVVGAGASSWRFFVQRVQGFRGRNWPTLSARIDIVSVVPGANGRDGQPVDYLATLTYFYRNSDLQSGDYSRSFGTEDEAQSWANSYKESTVTVHVDPRDPSRSVVREEDL